MSILTGFHKGADGVVRLSRASELLFEPTDPRQDPRHAGTVEPMWTLLDLTRGGGPDADEQFEYGCCPAPGVASDPGKNIESAAAQDLAGRPVLRAGTAPSAATNAASSIPASAFSPARSTSLFLAGVPDCAARFFN